MNVVLVGYRGSGKSTIGRLLASQLWRPFVDLDQQIVAEAGRPISEIFATQGENTFRDLESAALGRALAADEQILAVGGGAVVRPANQQLLKQENVKVIYLRCEAPELLRRIQADPASGAMRPSLTAHGGGIEEIRALLEQREPLYRALCQAELDVTNLTPQEAVGRLARMI